MYHRYKLLSFVSRKHYQNLQHSPRPACYGQNSVLFQLYNAPTTPQLFFVPYNPLFQSICATICLTQGTAALYYKSTYKQNAPFHSLKEQSKRNTCNLGFRLKHHGHGNMLMTFRRWELGSCLGQGRKLPVSVSHGRRAINKCSLSQCYARKPGAILHRWSCMVSITLAFAWGWGEAYCWAERKRRLE